MAVVQTVPGHIGADTPGQLLTHEHVCVLSNEIRQDAPDYAHRWDQDPQVADAAVKPRECAAKGVDTIVDPKVIGQGHRVPRIVRVDEQVDVDVIVATGVYTHNEAPLQFLCTGGAALR